MGQGFSISPPAVLTYLPATRLYVNSGSGNNSGNGTISDPLQSLEEALKNVYARRLNGDITECTIYLSGATGDYDDTSAIIYYWPNKYSSDISYVQIRGWDGADTASSPKYGHLYTGSAVLYGNPAETIVDFTGWNSGSMLGLYKDTGFTDPVDFGAAGSLGPLSKGWSLTTATVGNTRPIAHIVDHIGNTNTIRIAGDSSVSAKYDTGASAWDTGGRGSAGIKVIRYGAKIDFKQLYEAWGQNSNLFVDKNQRQRFYYLELTSSSPLTVRGGPLDRVGRFNTAGIWSFNDCHIMTEHGSGYGGFQDYYRCYIGSSDNPSAGTRLGRARWNACIIDGQHTEGYPNDGFGISSEGIFNSQNIIQNYPNSGLAFNRGADFADPGREPNYTVLHFTASRGIRATARVTATEGYPIRLIGELSDNTNYALTLISGSAWNWNNTSDLRIEGGSTDGWVSVTNGETQGSADVSTGTFIYGYTSSFGVQPDFATDFSASFYSLIDQAD